MAMSNESRKEKGHQTSRPGVINSGTSIRTDLLNVALSSRTLIDDHLAKNSRTR